MKMKINIKDFVRLCIEADKALLKTKPLTSKKRKEIQNRLKQNTLYLKQKEG
jgi:DNA-directed RNA polymerase alpha subunit